MMKFNKLNGLATAVMMALSVAAQADLITFDPTGTPGAAGNISNVGTLDWLPGSTLSVNALGQSPAGLFVGESFTTYFQANLGTVLDGNTSASVFTNGGGGNYFTVVGAAGETVTSCGGLFCQNATFGFNPSDPVNFVKIFAVGGFANNLTGAGFTGTSILTGHVISPIFSANFNGVSPTGPSPLDQSPNGDQWGGTQSNIGSGGSTITVMIDSVNANYFPDLMAGGFFTLSAFNSSEILPFNQVDPSRCLSDGVTDCAIASNVGTFNGLPSILGGTGPDVLFQSDANQSFKRTIPEPGTLALISVALLGMGKFGRRRFNA